MSESELQALPWLFDFWAMDHQLPPSGDWRAWVVLGGRGAGKTRAGSEWVRAQVEGPRPRDEGKRKRIALIGETIDQAREVMVFGESGLLACSPPDRRPKWVASASNCNGPMGLWRRCFPPMIPKPCAARNLTARGWTKFANGKKRKM